VTANLLFSHINVRRAAGDAVFNFTTSTIGFEEIKQLGKDHCAAKTNALTLIKKALSIILFATK